MVSSAISGTFSNMIQGTSRQDNQTITDGTSAVDFSKVMDRSLEKNNSGASAGSFTEKVAPSVKKSDAAVNIGNQDSSKLQNSSKTQNTAKADRDTADSLKNDISDGVTKIKDKIKEILDVSGEDIENAMEQLGLTMVDLLDPQKLTDLVVMLNGGGDSLSFLTDADALLALNTILDTQTAVTQQLMTDYDISPEDFKDVINSEAGGLVESMNPAADDGTDDTVRSFKNDIQPEDQHMDDESVNDVIASKLKVKTEGSSSDNKEDNDSHAFLSNEHSDGIEQITADMSQSIQKTFSEVVGDVSNVNQADIVRQVVEQIKLTTGQQMQSIEVMLNPENLGKVHVTVTAREGVVTAQLTAQNEQVKAALENQMTALKEHFNNQGIKVEAVEITIESHGFEAEQNLEGNDSNQAGQERKASRKLDLSSLEGLEESEMTDQEIRARDAIVNGDSSVEYSA